MRILPSLLVSASLAMHALADDGWQKARWGMTKEEVAKVYPEAKPDSGGGAGQLAVGLSLTEYPLVDGKFQVKFLFDAQKKLASVRVEEDGRHPRNGDKTFLRLKQLLTARYGKPVREEPPEPMVSSLAWHDGDREIQLTQTLGNSLETASVSISYSGRATAAHEREAKAAEEKSMIDKL